MSSSTPRQGPPDVVDWPSTLTAHVVDTRDADHPRAHGYDLRRDIARHYTHAEAVLLALTGELPSEIAARAFGVACCFLASMESIEHAATHATALARLCASPEASVVATAAIASAQRAADAVRCRAALLEALREGDALPPEAVDPADEVAVAELLDALPGDWPRSLVGLGLESALLAVLHDCGLHTTAQLTSAVTMARLPIVLAEASAVTPGAIMAWPTNTTPTFDFSAMGTPPAEEEDRR